MRKFGKVVVDKVVQYAEPEVVGLCTPFSLRYGTA
jgi:hypothetical protein